MSLYKLPDRLIKLNRMRPPPLNSSLSSPSINLRSTLSPITPRHVSSCRPFPFISENTVNIFNPSFLFTSG
ncbi:hypothetical protein JHK86_032910 [Glycine max]|nr:hypothetical protein JHK86_032910 [Glycine max]